MSLLITGLIIFFIPHGIPVIPSLKQRIVGQFGENVYKGIFSVISAVGLVLIVMGKADAEFIAIWHPSLYFGEFTKILMLPAMVLLVSAYIPCNIKRHTRNPMLWGVIIWAASHLMINGDMASMTLFGSFLGYALIARASANARGTSLQKIKKPVINDIIVIAVGGAAYALVGIFHQDLFGAAIV